MKSKHIEIRPVDFKVEVVVDDYDATYRLVEATGSEHSNQGTTPGTDVQITIGAQPMTSDPSAMRRYTQQFRGLCERY